MNSINSFSGDYRWLSNFYRCERPIELDGEFYPSTEHAYQAAKFPPDRRNSFRYGTPGNAKRLGRGPGHRTDVDWGLVKVDVMYKLLKQKFTPGTYLSTRLLATGDAEIIEGNAWGDRFWGVCRGEGENNLGKLLMRIRTELKDVA